MTVSELIEELKRHPPGKPVRVCVHRVTILSEEGEYSENLTEGDGEETDEVRNEGGFVLIWGGKP